MSRTNYIFVDLENVQVTDLDRIAGKPVAVTLILGTHHKRLPLDLVKAIHAYSTQVRLVETALGGKNALDFILAYEAGAQAAKDPAGYFHVISRDTGFDALIKHLRAQAVLAARHQSLGEIPVLMNLAERVSHLTTRFKTQGGNRPRKRKTLESQIQAVFGQCLATADLTETVRGLVKAKAIAISANEEILHLLQPATVSAS
jgi:hypothetical protein